MSKTYTQVAKSFGKRIVLLRKQKNLTQEELALKANIERSYMGTIERGERNPTLKKIYQISKALKVEVHELFT